MSILGVVVRVRPQDVQAVASRLKALPGVDLSLDAGDGRLVLVIEDIARDGTVHAAALTMDEITHWPQVLNTSLVYEYSGPDAPAASAAVSDFRDWRDRPRSAPLPITMS